jgi:hypothetical protein
MTAIRDVADRLHRCAADLPAAQAHRRAFIDTYRRTTLAVGDAVAAARFEDPDWVGRWDVAFAELFLHAHDADRAGGRVPRPWQLAFDADPDLPDLVHVLLGINAHVNYDLPQALLAVLDDADFADPVLMARRRRDHERIDAVLAERVADEDDELSAGKRWRDRLLTPANRAASKRFLREARRKVWHNTEELQRARRAGPDAYAARLGELEVLAAARIADLLAPGQVLLRLAVAGFGVVLPPESRAPAP